MKKFIGYGTRGAILLGCLSLAGACSGSDGPGASMDGGSGDAQTGGAAGTHAAGAGGAGATSAGGAFAGGARGDASVGAGGTSSAGGGSNPRGNGGKQADASVAPDAGPSGANSDASAPIPDAAADAAGLANADADGSAVTKPPYRFVVVTNGSIKKGGVMTVASPYCHENFGETCAWGNYDSCPDCWLGQQPLPEPTCQSNATTYVECSYLLPEVTNDVTLQIYSAGITFKDVSVTATPANSQSLCTRGSDDYGFYENCVLLIPSNPTTLRVEWSQLPP